MADSVQPHRQQSTRLRCPWDSPGKNTGVGCHFLLQCMKVKSEKWKWSRSVVSDSAWPHGLQPTRLLHPWDFPGKGTGVGCHCLLHHWRWICLIYFAFIIYLFEWYPHCWCSKYTLAPLWEISSDILSKSHHMRDLDQIISKYLQGVSSSETLLWPHPAYAGSKFREADLGLKP